MIQPFKKLPQGYYRLVIVGWIILPLLLAGIAAGMEERSYEQRDTFWGVFIFGIPMYYILARFGVWIYDGFKIDKN